MCELSFFIGKGDLLLITTGKNRFSPVRRTFEGAEAGRQSASPERKKMLFYSTAVPMKSRNSFTALKRKEGQKMNVLMLNGGSRKNGNTAIALEEMRKVFEADHA